MEMQIAPETVREFVISGHGNLARIMAMLDEVPELLNVKHRWAEDDWESAIQAAAHVGSVAVADYLLARGAPLEICTAAMLGRRGEVESLLRADAALIYERGAHGIPLLAHSALNGDIELFSFLMMQGAEEGISFALHNAVASGRTGLARWILTNARPDLEWKNYEGKTALAVAIEQGDRELQALLRERGA